MTFDLLPFPRSRDLLIDSFQMAAKRHIVHGFLEVDVTVPRRILKGTFGTDGRPLSFTGFVIAKFRKSNLRPSDCSGISRLAEPTDCLS